MSKLSKPSTTTIEQFNFGNLTNLIVSIENAQRFSEATARDRSLRIRTALPYIVREIKQREARVAELRQLQRRAISAVAKLENS